MKYVYVVVCNENVSSTGYDTIEKAIEFIESRYGSPKQVQGWFWKDARGSEYKIKEIKIV